MLVAFKPNSKQVQSALFSCQMSLLTHNAAASVVCCFFCTKFVYILFFDSLQLIEPRLWFPLLEIQNQNSSLCSQWCVEKSLLTFGRTSPLNGIHD